MLSYPESLKSSTDVLKVPVYGTFVRSFSVADSVVSRIVWSSPICLYKGNLCRENDIIEVNYVNMASVSLFDFLLW